MSQIKEKREISEIISEGIRSENLPKIFTLLYNIMEEKEVVEEEREQLLSKILKKVEARDLFNFAKEQMEAGIVEDKKNLICEALSKFGSYIDPLTREVESIVGLLDKLCGKVHRTLFKINLKQSIAKEKRAVSLKLISLAGRKLSAILEELITGELTDGDVAAGVLERKVEGAEDLKKWSKRRAEHLAVDSSSIYAVEILNRSLKKKEVFISKEFPSELTTQILRGGSLSSNLAALGAIYTLLCSKNLEIKRLRELLMAEFERKTFVPVLSAITFSVFKAYSRKNKRDLHSQIYLQSNLEKFLHFSGKEELMITESLQEGDFRWIKGFVWGRIFEEFMEDFREEVLNAFTDALRHLVDNNPLYIIKPLRSLVFLSISEKTIQIILSILPEALKSSRSGVTHKVHHQVAQIIRDLTFSKSIKDLSKVASTSQGKKAIIEIIQAGSAEVVNEILRLFKLSSTSWWLVTGQQEEKISISDETKRQVEKKIREVLGEQSEEPLLSLIGAEGDDSR